MSIPTTEPSDKTALVERVAQAIAEAEVSWIGDEDHEWARDLARAALVPVRQDAQKLAEDFEKHIEQAREAARECRARAFQTAGSEVYMREEIVLKHVIERLSALFPEESEQQ